MDNNHTYGTLFVYLRVKICRFKRRFLNVLLNAYKERFNNAPNDE